LGVRPTAAERIAVAFLEQERSPQPPVQEENFRLQHAVNCRHQNKKKALITEHREYFNLVNAKKNQLDHSSF